ncbi:DNA cytosine methyltransferase [Undibacterium sp. Di26W]|uniref:DNA cytosine methyltransferase n=1 Tax=Undibacterium sp. Di26W TaxID=3413035 RepID=UPI003BF19DF1
MKKPVAYYNEIDPFCVEWLRNLIKAGHIAHGIVDNRSIADVSPDDLTDFTQCHFFAGIGVWSYALRQGGWRDDEQVWTGSCPCQPFSAAGSKRGFDDERHLWPTFYHLIAECQPQTVFGEQVASSDGLAWLDDVQADLERANYASAAVDICAAGVGAPHIRQRLYFVAHRMGNAYSAGREVCEQNSLGGKRWGQEGGTTEQSGRAFSRMGYTNGHGPQRRIRGGRMRNGHWSTDRLDVSAQLTGWPTPTTPSGGQTAPEGTSATGMTPAGKKVQVTLQYVAMLAGWVTPKVADVRTESLESRDARNTRMKEAGNAKGCGSAPLSSQTLLTGWPTPNANNKGACTTWESFSKRKEDKRQQNLQDVVQITQPVRLTVFGEVLTGLDAKMESSGQLNPGLARWLMGLPKEWDDCVPTATRSTRKRQSSSSKLPDTSYLDLI